MSKKSDITESKDDELDLDNDDYDVEVASASDNDDEIDAHTSDGDGKTILKEKINRKITKPKDDEDDVSDLEDSDLIEGHDDPDQYKLDMMEPDELTNQMLSPPEIYRNKTYKGTLDVIKHKLLKYQAGIDEYIVPPELSRTSHILQKAERTELIGIRAQHIATGAEPYVEIINETDPIQIATKELKLRRFPLKIKRPINSLVSEIKDPNYMTIIWHN